MKIGHTFGCSSTFVDIYLVRILSRNPATRLPTMDKTTEEHATVMVHPIAKFSSFSQSSVSEVAFVMA